jgi:hypothetical protein
MGLAKSVALVLLAFIGLTAESKAIWQGPTEILSGAWGPENTQFGIEYGDTNDVFGGPFYILLDEKIIVTDIMNGRVKVYDSAGTLTKVVKCLKTQTGDWNEECRFEGDYLQTIVDGSIWTTLYKQKKWNYYLYTPTGQLLKTYTERPLELGRVTEKRIPSTKQYKVTVKYPDKEWTIIGKGQFPTYMRDSSGNLYAYGENQAVRYDSCGKELARLTMPKAQVETVSRGEQVDPKDIFLEEYGSPVIAPNGDVYTWKRTPDKYSIVKWTWQDDPNALSGPDAPTGLAVTPSTTGLYLTWKASPQDPGCVTGYEIARSTSSGGVYTTLATVDKGVLKYNDTTAIAGATYYYKVRAVSGTEYSPYTSEVSGKR